MNRDRQGRDIPPLSPFVRLVRSADAHGSRLCPPSLSLISLALKQPEAPPIGHNIIIGAIAKGKKQ